MDFQPVRRKGSQRPNKLNPERALNTDSQQSRKSSEVIFVIMVTFSSIQELNIFLVKCQDCKYVNRTFDFCLDIVLNIDREKPRIVEPKKKKKKQAHKEETPHQEEEHKEEPPVDGAPVEEEKVSDLQNEVQSQPKYKQIDPSEIKETAIPYFDANLFELYEPNIEEFTKHLNDHKENKEGESVDNLLYYSVSFWNIDNSRRSFKGLHSCRNSQQTEKLL